ncbi:hypothetical protein SAMN05216207_104643 [Pseudonocardia ammonioxydans]|uniref:Uncharacterized protein n=1 Tax=Pseudonocardia ammonioxydans TaxID=260086 RepID=A0A1I5GGD7_PSUAM|nr:hypothetical protein [Pseudonocardia ammonioxydans]SFO35075.1 hypothetical protein SAMN05216207_104643 [Pseudonocardia ammonioxydans]
MTSTEVVPVPEPCPVAVACWSCRSTDGLRAVVASSPDGDLCWTACSRCAAGGVHLRITRDAGLRLAREHREHAGPGRP